MAPLYWPLFAMGSLTFDNQGQSCQGTYQTTQEQGGGRGRGWGYGLSTVLASHNKKGISIEPLLRGQTQNKMAV